MRKGLVKLIHLPRQTVLSKVSK